jgi:hypothetical protein
MNVNGKTGQRELIAEKICLIHLLDIVTRRFGGRIMDDHSRDIKTSLTRQCFS